MEMSDSGEQGRLMRLKKRMSQRRPKFRQMESWRHVRLRDRWRRPTGIDNSMRQNMKGWPKDVNVGYGSPRVVRDLHPTGMEEVQVHNVGDLAIIDPETQVARIGGSVGNRKRVAIIKEAESQGIRVLNVGKAKKFLEIETEKPSELEEAQENEPEEEPKEPDEEEA